MSILLFTLSGLVVGVIARVFIRKSSMGLVATVLFGLTGAFLGGLAGIVLGGERALFQSNPTVIGGVLAVFFVLFLLGVRARARRRVAF